jgi:ketosteroid isomerase-like protein
MIAEGPAALREALGAFLAMKPVLRVEKTQLVMAGDVALALTRWTLDGVGTDGGAIRMGGESTDVLRRQADGRWLVLLDNPWGVSLLGGQGAS